jgi:hypothetical protein
VRIRSRRPRFGDLVLLDGARLQMCATVVAPAPGFWLRSEGSADAAADRFVTPSEWQALTWCTVRQRWERAA